MESEAVRETLARIQLEYVEMPSLTLTLCQVRRLWNLPEEVCELALVRLVQTGFLTQSREGIFLRRGLGYRSSGTTKTPESEEPLETPSEPDAEPSPEPTRRRGSVVDSDAEVVLGRSTLVDDAVDAID